jgi:ATP-dependent DNA ligase
LGLPGVFERTIFTRAIAVKDSAFIAAPHPKTIVAPTRPAMQKVLDAGWWGQMKIHGHRAQIHIAADESLPPIAYTRQGRPHTVPLPKEFLSELRRLLAPKNGYSAVDAEWLKPAGKLYLFDYLKHNGQVLSAYTYAERYQLLPRVYRSSCIETLPILRSAEECLEVLARSEPWVEGLVFKSPTTVGFRDSAIVRCRKAT